MGDTTRGLYEKFIISRTDGTSDPGEKHDGCDYFVLDLTHDKHALPALETYLASLRVEGKYLLLIADLDAKITKLRAAREAGSARPSDER